MKYITNNTITAYLAKLSAKKYGHAELVKKVLTVTSFIEWLSKENKVSKEDAKRFSEQLLKITHTYPVTKPPLNNLSSKAKLPLRYVGYILIALTVSILGAGIYNRFFLKVKTPLAYSTTPIQAGRTISFQGRLTDSLGNPITAPIDITYNFYTTSTGGSPITGSTRICTANGDVDGVFSSLIGNDVGPSCNTELPASIFTENPTVYLGVKVGSELSEMSPRQQIANVGYAINSETLQGMPPGQSTSSVPFINKDGDLLVAVSNPGIRSTFASANFTISSAQATTIQSAGSGDITLSATQGGALRFNTYYGTLGERMTILANGNVGIGNITPSMALDIVGSATTSGNLSSGGQVKLGELTAAPTSLGAGSLYYNSTTAKVYYNNGTVWTEVGAGAAGSDLFQRTLGSLAPMNITDAINTGAIATGSALVHLPGTINQDAWFNLGTGNVGVGTNNPTSKLQVVGGDILVDSSKGISSVGQDLIFRANTSTQVLRLLSNWTSAWSDDQGTDFFQFGQNNGMFSGFNGATLNRFAIVSNGTKITNENPSTATPPIGMLDVEGSGGVILNAGNVGIGNIAPGAKLDVTGNLNVSTYATMGASLALGTSTATPGTGNLDMSGNLTVAGAIKPGGNAGTNGYVLTSSGGSVNTWIDPAVLVATNGYWQRTLGSLAPMNITDDLNMGAIATGSAIVHLPGLTDQNAWFNLGLGNLGIGTISPDAKLAIVGDGQGAVFKLSQGYVDLPIATKLSSTVMSDLLLHLPLQNSLASSRSNYPTFTRSDTSNGNTSTYTTDAGWITNAYVYTNVARFEKTNISHGVFVENSRRNLMDYSSFEEGSTTGWTASGLETNTVSSIYRKHGTYSATVGDTNGTGGTFVRSRTLTSGQTYPFFCYVQNTTAGALRGTVDTSVAQLYAGASTITTSYTPLDGGWYKLEGVVTGTGGAVGYGVNIGINKQIQLDACQIEADASSNGVPYSTSFVYNNWGTNYIRGEETLSYLAWNGTENYNFVDSLIKADKGTLSFWFRPEWRASAPTSDLYLFQVPNVIQVFYQASDDKIYAQMYNGTNWTTVSVASAAQTFAALSDHYISVRWDNTSGLILNLDGTETSLPTTWTSQEQQITSTTNLYIGSKSTAANRADGLISDLAIFNRSLQKYEVAQIYNNKAPIEDFARNDLVQLQQANNQTYQRGYIRLTGDVTAGGAVSAGTVSTTYLSGNYVGTNNAANFSNHTVLHLPFQGTIDGSRQEVGTFTRPDSVSPAATVTNENTHQLTNKNANEPRLGRGLYASDANQDYQYNTGNFGVTIEDSRKNLALDSSFETLTPWVSGASLTATQTTMKAIHGTYGVNLVATANTRYFQTLDLTTITAGTTVQLSTYVYRNDTNSWGGTIDTSVAQLYARTDDAITALTPTYIPLGNGWYQMIASFTSTAASNWDVGVYIPSGKNIIVDGFQAEVEGDGTSAYYPSSYIPTTTSSVIRAPEKLSYPLPTSFKSDKGGFSFWFKPMWARNTTGDNTNKYFIYIPNVMRVSLDGTNDRFLVEQYNGASWVATANTGTGTVNQYQWNHLACGWYYNLNYCRLNGSAYSSSAVWTPQPTAGKILYVGSDDTGANQANSLIAGFTLFDVYLNPTQQYQLYLNRGKFDDYFRTDTISLSDITSTASQSGSLNITGVYRGGMGSQTAPAFSFGVDTNTGLFSSTPDTLNFTTGGTEALRIDSTGNIGIGNTAPGAKLDIGKAGSTLGTLRLEGDTSGYTQIQPATNAGNWTLTLPPNAGTSGYILTTDGSGTTSWSASVPASSVPFSGITSGTNTTAAMVVGTGASLTYSGTGTINASSLIGGTWAVPGAIGGTTANTGAFTTLSSTSGTNLATSTGNVGIGTASPSQKLQVAGTALIENLNLGTTPVAGARLTSYGQVNIIGDTSLVWNNAHIYLNDVNTGENYAFGNRGNYFSFSSETAPHNAIRMVIVAATGNVGIGTVAPAAKLDILGDLNVSTYATVGASLALGTSTATPGAGNLNMSGNLNLSGAFMPGGNAGTAGYFLTSSGAGTAPSWTTTVGASSVPFSGITSGTNTTAAMVVGAGGSLNYTSTGTINASSLIGGTWAAPGAIGGTTANTGKFTTLEATSTGNALTLSGAGANIAFSGAGLAQITTATNQHLALMPAGTGNVGIGTTSPNGKLQVAADLNSAIRISNAAGTGNILNISGNNTVDTTSPSIRSDGASLVLNGATGGNLYFNLDASANSIFSNNVGIGVTPTAKLDVLGNLNVSTYATAGASLALGTSSASAGAGNLDMSGDLTLSGAFKPAGNAGTAGYFLTSAGTGSAPTWTSTVGASSVPFSGITGPSTNTTAAMTVGSGASLNYTGTGTINASTLIGGTWAVPGAIGTTTPNTGKFTSIWGTSFGVGYDPSTITGGVAAFNGNVGIGTISPAAKLDILGNLNVSSYATVAASLALGTSNAAAGAGNLDMSGNLTIAGAIKPGGNAGTSGYILTSGGGGVNTWTDPLALTGGSNLWQRTLSSLAPINITDALNLGSTATASALVHLPGTNNQNAWFNLGTGNLGVGTATPSALLSIGSINITSNPQIAIGTNLAESNYAISVSGGRTMFGYDQVDGASVINSGGSKGFKLMVNGTDNSWLSGTQALTVLSNGNVGIGVTNPTSKLEIAGTSSTISNASGDITFSAASGNIAFSNNNLTNITNISTLGQIQIGQFASAPVALGAGSLYYNSTGGKVYYNNGTAWVEIGASFWQQTLGSLAPTNVTNDINTGSTATASALVHLPGTTNHNAWLNLGTGNVGIGTATPTGAKLQVNGSIMADELIDTTGAGAYYVDPAGSSSLGGNVIIASTYGVDTTAAGTLYLGNTNSSIIGIGTSATARTITMGNSTGATALSLNSGTGGIALNSTDVINLTSSKAAGAGITEAFSLKTSTDLGATDELFQLGDSLANMITVLGNGYVGIGTSTPGVQLQVHEPGTGNSQLTVSTDSDTNNSILAFTTDANGVAPKDARIGLDAANGVLKIVYGSPFAASTNGLVINSSGNIGIGTVSPLDQVEIANTTAGGRMIISNGAGATRKALLFQAPGGTYSYARIVAQDYGTSTGLNLALQDTGGNVGIGTTTPTAAKLQVVGTVMADQFTDTTGSGAYYVNPAGTSVLGGNIEMRSATPSILGYDSSTATYYTLHFKGNSGDTTASISVDGATSGSGKIDVGTVDPPYTIDGKKYATYQPSMTGVKEETTGVVRLTQKNSQLQAYIYTINFNNQTEGSDLWLFNKTANLKQNIKDMTVLLSSASNGKTWYSVDKDNQQLTFFSSSPTEISYRLTAPRFDSSTWKNERDASDPSIGFVINSDGTVNTTSSTQVAYTAPQLTKDANNTFVLVGDFIDEFINVNKALIANIKSGFIQAEDVVINNTLTARETISSSLTASVARIETLIISKKINAPVVETVDLKASGSSELSSISTNTVKPIGNDVTVDLSKNSSPSGSLARLVINGLDNAPVAQFDAAGNATLAGTLVADQVVASSSAFGSSSIAQLKTDNASVSGTLIAKEVQADNINNSLQQFSSSINNVQQQLAALQNAPLPNAQHYQKLDDSIIGNITITDTANIYKATISDSLMVGSVLVEQNSLLALSTDLKISSLSTIHLFDDAVVIAKNGTVAIKGEVSASSLAIKNVEGATVASIDASGSAHFNEVVAKKFTLDKIATNGAVIADSGMRNAQNEPIPAIKTNTEVAGTGSVPQDAKEVIIYNDNVTENSLIYLTPTADNVQNQLSVTKKTTCAANTTQTTCTPYFVISSNSAIHPEVPFNWLIIN